MQVGKENFVVSQEDWTLHRKGYQDQERHTEKVREAIRNNLPDLVSEENIILSKGKEVIRIPVRSLDEYKIRYNHDAAKHVGQGDGDSAVGDVIARDGRKAKGTGTGEEAGESPGVDYYEAEVSLAELEELLFSELELPNLQEKEQAEIVTEDIAFHDIRKKGLMGNLDKKRTLLAAFKRNATAGDPSFAPIFEDDLRFKTWDETIRPESRAVVLAMMDTSGSMGTIQKYMARSFFYWMIKFLRTTYSAVEIAFIAHHTEAKVVSEEAFFTKGESGGTRCSSAYRKALELIEEKYHPDRYNIYPFHFSDGENLTMDNPVCIELIEEIMSVSSMFGYGEVNIHNRYSTLMNAFQAIEDPKFRTFVLRKKSDVYEALKAFFYREEAHV